MGLVGPYRRFIKGFTHIAQPLHEYLSGDGEDKKSELVTLMEKALHAFGVLKEACITAPMLAFADFERPFLLKNDVLKAGIGTVLLWK